MANKVNVTIPVDPLNKSDKQEYSVFIQGKRTTIKKGVEVSVKPIVKEIYEESLHKNANANKRDPEMKVFHEE